MVSRMTLILHILQCKGVFWLYEQPTSSLLWSHPRMEQFCTKYDCYRCFTWMGSYGADSPKGTTLWSSKPGVKKLARHYPANRSFNSEMTRKSITCEGKVSVSGGADLKKSQAYTAQFGMATLTTWMDEPFNYDMPLLDDAKIPNLWAPIPKKDRWEDARLVEVFQFLSLN